MSARKRRADLDRAAVFEAILGDLGQDAPAPADAGGASAIADIVYNDRQPRQFMDPVALAALTASIRERGVLEPVLVRASSRATSWSPASGAPGRRAMPASPTFRRSSSTSTTARRWRSPSWRTSSARTSTPSRRPRRSCSCSSSASSSIARVPWPCSTSTSRSLAGAPRRRASARRRSRWRSSCSSASVASRRRRSWPTACRSSASPTSSSVAVREGRLSFTKAQALARIDDPDDRRRLLDGGRRDELSLSQIRRRITELRADHRIERASTTRCSTACMRRVGCCSGGRSPSCPRSG
jgi:ParB family transcriptional regulator, chromosome partitioning protein